MGQALPWRGEWPADLAEFWLEALDPKGASGDAPSVTFRDAYVDAETEAALKAWRDGLLLRVQPGGIVWPDQLPLLINHMGEPLGELRADLDGETFTAIGELEEEAATRVRGVWHVSDHMAYRRARIVDYGAGMRLVEVVEAELIEVSAVRTPDDPSTSLMVGNPGVRWLPESTVERFRRLELPGHATPGRPA